MPTLCSVKIGLNGVKSTSRNGYEQQITTNAAYLDNITISTLRLRI